MPRYSESRPGRVKAQDDILTGEDDVLRMNSERFAVGELLFRPSDIGLCILQWWGLLFDQLFYARIESGWLVPNDRRRDIVSSGGRAGTVLGEHRPCRRERATSWVPGQIVGGSGSKLDLKFSEND